MKPIISTLALISLTIGATAQDYTDAIRFSNNNYEGTARSVAMGSAFGALGADLSSASINPAGLGRYRASESSLSLGCNFNTTETDYYGYGADNDKISVPFNHFGSAFHSRPIFERTKGLVGFTFAVAFNRLADYNNNTTYRDMYGLNSMLDYFCMDQNINNDFSGRYAYDAGYIYDSYYDSFGDIVDMTHNVWEDPYGEGELSYDAREDINGGLIDHMQTIKHRGSKNELSLAFAWNISNKLYIGTSLGIQTIKFKETKNHYEEYFGLPLDDATFDMTYITKLKQKGSGVNLKLGAIYQPIKAFALGLSLHTPTMISMNEFYSAHITEAGTDLFKSPVSGEYRYNYRSPGRMVLSLAGFIGRFGIISLDYEKSNFKKCKFKEKENEDRDVAYYDLNNSIKEALQGSGMLRIGIEAKVLPQIALRAGYKTTTSPIIDKFTHTQKAKYNALSCGAGFKISNFSIDVAYVKSTKKGEHWVLPDTYGYIYETNMPGTFTSHNHNIQLTAGLRF